MHAFSPIALRRFGASLGADILTQARNGFYAASLFVLVVTAAMVLPFGQREQLGWLLPAVALNSMMITSFYFLAALVLLEKAEGVALARMVAPLRPAEYLLAKLVGLALLALVYNLVVGWVFLGLNLHVLPFAAGLVLASAMLCLTGFLASVRFRNISSFFFPSLPIAGLCMLPIAPFSLGWWHPILLLLPMQAPLELLRGASEPLPLWKIVYGVGYSALWLGIGFVAALRSWPHMED